MVLWNSTISEKREIADKIWEVEIEKPVGFSYTAGQYIWLIVPTLAYDDPRGNRRAFSLASSPSQKDKISIICRETESGYKKSLFSLSNGSKINFLGPFGSTFVLKQVASKEIVILAGGTGISPFLSMLRSDKEDNKSIHKTIIFITATPEDAFYIRELQKIADKKKYSFIHKTHGRFSWKDIPQGLDINTTQFFVNGPSEMIDQVFPVLLGNGVKRESLHFESNYPSSPSNLTIADIEKSLLDSKNLWFQVIANANQYFMITDRNGLILYANQAAQKMTGYTFDEMKGNTPRLWGGLMSAQFYSNLWKEKSRGKPYIGKFTNRRKNGEIYYTHSHISPMVGSDGEIIGFTTTEEDITQDILLKISLETEKIRNESLFSSIGDGMIVVDKKNRITRINVLACKMLGLRQDEVLGRNINDCFSVENSKGVPFSERDRPATIALKGGTITTTSANPLYYYVRKNKTKFPAAITVTPILLKRKVVGAIELFRDVSDIQSAVKTLSEAKVRDDAMLAGIGDGVVVVDREMKIEVFNPAAERITGLKSRDVLGTLWQEMLTAKTTGGKQLAVKDSPLFRAIYAGKTTTASDLLYTKKDNSIFSASITASPVKLGTKIIGAIVVFKDITKEKEIDRVKNEFISIASHQLKTPLGITKWYLEALLDDTYVKNAPSSVKGYFDVVLKNNERILSLVRQLLLVSRIDQGRVKNDPKLIDILVVLTNVVKELKFLARKKEIKLSLDIKEQKLQNLFIDPLLLYEVVENLVANAIEYTPNSGTVVVTVDKKDDMFLIQVKDTGIGISAEDQEKVFTKFFRSTQAVLQNPGGSGLGLYVVKSYVEGWGGKISIISSEGKGATFSIHLPIVPNSMQQKRP